MRLTMALELDTAQASMIVIILNTATARVIAMVRDTAPEHLMGMARTVQLAMAQSTEREAVWVNLTDIDNQKHENDETKLQKQCIM